MCQQKGHLVVTVDLLPRDELAALQQLKLERLLDRLETNPFYSPRLSHLAAKGRAIDKLSAIPPIDKVQILSDIDTHPPYGSIVGVPLDEIAAVHMTAGTSGSGQETHALTLRDVEAAGLLSSFAFRWAGLRFAEPAAFNIGHSNSSGATAMHRGIQALGRTPLLIAHVGFSERLELLATIDPVGIYGTPSTINGLLHTASELSFDVQARLPSLRFLLTSAEPYPIGWAERMMDAWGATLFEDYGATQSASSICASSCELGAVVDGQRGRLHFFDWSFLVEIVDPVTALQVSEGEWGELYITTLDKEASPLLRFRTADRVRYLGTDRCMCGRSLVSIEAGSISRLDDLLKIKGQNVWPADIEALLFSRPDVREFLGEVAIGPHGRDELYLRIALSTDVSEPAVAADAVSIRSSFKARFNITPQVELVAIETLPQWKSPEQKSRRLIDRRQEGLLR